MQNKDTNFLDCVGLIQLCEDVSQFEDIEVYYNANKVILYTLLDNETCNKYEITLTGYRSALKIKSTSGRFVLAKKWHREDLIDALKHPKDEVTEEDIRKALEDIE